MRRVYGIDYSPWTQRACWALHARRVDYRFRQYKPTLDELAMRFRLGRWSGTISVPVLVDDERGPVEGSEAIARLANELGEGPDLFADEGAVARWTELAEPALGYGRARSIDALIASPEEQSEALSAVMPRAVTPAFRWVARSIAARTKDKYAQPPRSAMTTFLDALRDALGSGSEHLIGDAITYADLLAASALEMVQPGAQCRRGPRQRQSWTDPELAESHRDLLEWRDRLVERSGFSI